jgi:hypothetical protein
MINFRLPILFIVLISLALLAATLFYGNFWPWYWRQNFSLMKAGWNMIKLFRKHDLFERVDDEGDDDNKDAKRLEDQGVFFEQFCEYWDKTRRSDENERLEADRDDLDLTRQVSRIPLEYAIYANLNDEQLEENWHKFVSNKCSKYYDKLICLNGLIFDWKEGIVKR